jgi:WD40 repeat protein
MLYCKAGGHIYAGCGDNKIYIFSLEDGKLVRTMEGHDDYIHSIHNM